MTGEMNPNNAVDESWPLLSKTEEDLYAMAFSEVRGESRRQGLWAKALSESLGDEQKAEALYIRFCAEQLSQEQKSQNLQRDEAIRKRLETERNEKIPFNCPKCGIKHSVAKGQILDYCIAPRYPNWFFHCPDCKHTFDIRTVSSETLKDIIPHLLPPPDKMPTPDSRTAIKAKYLVAFLACAAVMILFACIAVAVGGISGFLPMVILWATIFATWRAITKRSPHDPKTTAADAASVGNEHSETPLPDRPSSLGPDHPSPSSASIPSAKHVPSHMNPGATFVEHAAGIAEHAAGIVDIGVKATKPLLARLKRDITTGFHAATELIGDAINRKPAAIDDSPQSSCPAQEQAADEPPPAGTEIKPPAPHSQAETFTLHEASRKGLTEEVELLLSQEVDVNFRDETGSTALMWGAVSGHDEVVKLLLQAGADPCLVNNFGETALDLAKEQGHLGVTKLLESVTTVRRIQGHPRPTSNGRG